jgi:GNAT superfamily N-acetyltransferase
MIEVAPFDPHAASAHEWAEYHAHRRARAEEDDPGEPVPADADFEHDARRHWPLHRSWRLVARLDGQLVGSVGFWFRREATPDFAAYAPFMYAWGGVQRAWRRRGVATALLRGMLAFMRPHEKTTATIGTHLPEGQAFLAAVGAVEKNRNVSNRLDFSALDWDEVARWRAAAILPGTGLRWEVHAGRVPLQRLAALQAQFTAMLSDMPMGTLAVPPPRYELASYAAWDQEIERRGGEHLLTVLLDGETAAGMSEASWSPRVPDRVHQELTAVAPAWRGKGLAKGLKAAMLLLVRERHPRARLMTTSNAEANAPILAINRRLGFAEFRRDSSYQLGRDALERWLAGR